ncbi:hypothetical protein AB5I41_12960 [Sphingomonas sp. MMS24-JH45]
MTGSGKRTSAAARRRDLVEAAVRVLAERGAAGASVRTIAAAAGVCAGAGDAWLRRRRPAGRGGVDHVAGEVDAALDAAVATAGRIRARLGAYVAANLAAPIADPALLATWIALWSLARRNTTGVMARHGHHYAAFRSWRGCSRTAACRPNGCGSRRWGDVVRCGWNCACRPTASDTDEARGDRGGGSLAGIWRQRPTSVRERSREAGAHVIDSLEPNGARGRKPLRQIPEQ